jgi:hypothetical protein
MADDDSFVLRSGILSRSHHEDGGNGAVAVSGDRGMDGLNVVSTDRWTAVRLREALTCS